MNLNTKTVATISTGVLLLAQSCSGSNFEAEFGSGASLVLDFLKCSTIEEKRALFQSGKYDKKVLKQFVSRSHIDAFFDESSKFRVAANFNFEQHETPLEAAFLKGDTSLVINWLTKASDELVLELVKYFPESDLPDLYKMVKESESRFKLIYHKDRLSLFKEVILNDDLEFLNMILGKDGLSVHFIAKRLKNLHSVNNRCTALLSTKILEASHSDRSAILSSAVKDANKKVVELLIKNGSRADAYDEKGISLIMQLASTKRPNYAEARHQANLCEIARILIDNGAELEVVGSEDNLLPFEMAERAKNIHLAEYLRNQTPPPQI